MVLRNDILYSFSIVQNVTQKVILIFLKLLMQDLDTKVLYVSLCVYFSVSSASISSQRNAMTNDFYIHSCKVLHL